ncbi:MYXO-CTERM domain-containing protein [Amycolatopsis lexingtonensis]|uniref:MYXO-CTERM domain-containing protein n=1 Tax=Amycolatopsis lexingtonensis TaxID=218822 RepID=A0ABR9I861_9PSEU|nr:streptophobe family protein [Amycolatopsis lexingtonensis]MBE1499371.1 MYXO-CTERM domain-containing protein [Amycolatopsis lexingtonensis]
MREVVRGLAAAAAAVLAMAGVAAAGLLLLGGEQAGSATGAVVAVAVGGSVDLQAAAAGGLPVGLSGDLHGMPLGVSLAGALVLGWLLLRRREGLLVRGGVAVVAFTGAVGAVAVWAAGKVSLPGGAGAPRGCGPARLPGTGLSARVGQALPGKLGGPFAGAGGLGTGPSAPAGSPTHLEAAFSVALGPTLAAALVWGLVVVGACWLIARFPTIATTLRTLRWPLAAFTVVCLAAAGVLGGGAAAGAVLLLLPQLLPAVVLTGLGVPWQLGTTGLLSCAPDTTFPATHWIAGVVLLGLGIAVALRRRRPPLRQAAELAAVVGGVLAGTALLSRFAVDLSVTAFGFSVPVLGADLAANPLLALAAGVAGGAVAGFAGSLLVRGISVFSRAWTR